MLDGDFKDDAVIPAIFSEYDDEYREGKPYAYVIPERISVSGISCESGKDFVFLGNENQFDTVITGRK